MSADRHVVHMERLPRSIEIVVDRLFDHLHIRLRPGLLHIETVSVSVVDISHGRVRAVTMVISVGVVVESICLISQGLELVTESERHIVLRDLRIAPHPGLRDEPGRLDKLTVRRADVPDRRIEVIEDEAFCGKLIECRSELRVDHISGESFRCEKDQVLPLKDPRIFVHRGRLSLR